MSSHERITVLGATGSIGCSTLRVLAQHPSRYSLFAITANTNAELMAELCVQYKPEVAVMVDADAAQRLCRLLAERQLDTEVLSGEESLAAVASDSRTDRVMAAIVGGAGLKPTLAAAKAGKKVLLANKEALVMAGDLFIETAVKYGAVVLPVDSEHNAIFQCLPAEVCTHRLNPLDYGINRLILTASGGPLLNTPLDSFSSITPDQACDHPNWSMGRKISVDSATMMNKSLELIEACYLFNLSSAHIDIVIHPQSIVHSMVSYDDGSVLAQMGNPDMRTPIAHSLAWPERITAGVDSLDLVASGTLEFLDPDFSRFPCLAMGYDAARTGGSAPTVLNAANEIAVQAFLDERTRFDQIPVIIERVLARDWPGKFNSLEEILETDRQARQFAHELVEKIS